jgi:uncharacterized protein YdhG (YjbR/CyaY superfamily)
MPNEIDAYIQNFPQDIQTLLQTLRAAIQQAAPEATEAIKYGIPTYVLQGNLVHFAAYKKHIGFYPAPSGLLAFEEALSTYKRSKGAVQFPLDQPLPLELVKKIVEFRVTENRQKKAK